MAVNGIEIKYGQKWLTTEGERLRVKELGQDYAVLEHSNGRCEYFHMNGVSKKNPSVRLLRLAHPAVSAVPEFLEGQKWKRRDEQIATIISTTHCGQVGGNKYPILAQVDGHNSLAYDSAGLYSLDGRLGSPLDLVELIQDVPGPDDFGYEAPAPVQEAVELTIFPDIAEHDRAVGAVKLSDCYLPKEKQVCAPDLLDAAAGHMRNRAATYDKPEGERSIAQVVTAFNAIHGTAMTEVQGWHFMSLLKQVRAFSSGKAHRDSLEDNIAYSALMGEAMLKGGAQ